MKTKKFTISLLLAVGILAAGTAYAAAGIAGGHPEPPAPEGEGPPGDANVGRALLEERSDGGAVLRLDDDEGVMVVGLDAQIEAAMRRAVCAEDAATRPRVTAEAAEPASEQTAATAERVIAALDCSVVGFHMTIDGTHLTYVIGVNSESAAAALESRLAETAQSIDGNVIVEGRDRR